MKIQWTSQRLPGPAAARTKEEWKSITLGTHQTARGLFRELQEKRCNVTSVAYELLCKIPIRQGTREQIRLARASALDFGVAHAITLNCLFRTAHHFGLKLLPPEVGPQLRLQYCDQTRGECLLVAMNPVTCNSYPYIFAVRSRENSYWLDTQYGYRGHLWDPSESWVFAV